MNRRQRLAALWFFGTLAVLITFIHHVAKPAWQPSPELVAAQAATGHQPEARAASEKPVELGAQESFDPNVLVKNPYQFKGHSRVLDARQTPVLMPNGSQLRGTLVPFVCMKFERMLDEHTAVYEVQAYEDGVVMPQGELAVILSDSTPPDPKQRWRIRVEGPMDGWNGFGAKITVTAVRFDGYRIPTPEETAAAAEAQAKRQAEEAERRKQIDAAFAEQQQRVQERQQQQQQQGICVVACER